MAAPRRSAAEWREIVEDWLASGRSKDEYARALGVSPVTLGWWRWKLGASAEDEPGRLAPEFAEVVVIGSRPDGEDGEAGRGRAPDFVVEVGDLRVRVAPGFDAPELRRLVETLC